MKTRSAIAAVLLVTAKGAAAGDPFADADVAPPDVRLYVHVEDAAAIRAALAPRPLARWVDAWLNRGQLPAAWQRLCTMAGAEPAALLDTCLGHSVTLLSRGGEPPAWTLITDIDPDRSAALLQGMQAQVLAPRNDAGLFQLPAQELIVARSERRVLVAPQGQPGLLYDVLPLLARPAGAATLAADPAIAEGRRLGAASAGVLVRHAEPLGGWSVGVANLDGDFVSLRHASHFQSAPFRSRVSALSFDPQPVACLAASTFLAYIEPTDIAGGPLDAFLQAVLGEPMLTSALASNLGPRQITALSEVHGAPPNSALLPGVARAYEVRDAAQAWGQVDAYMARLLPALAALGQGAFALTMPEPAAMPPGQPRRVDASGLAKWLAGDVPGAAGASLCWIVVDLPAAQGPAPGWCIIATDAGQLEDLAKALRTSPCAPGAETPGTTPSRPDRWTSCGTLDGRRLAAQVARWRGAAGALARPGEAAAMVEALDLLAEFAGGVQSGSWQMARPAPECLVIEARLLLAPAESEGPPPQPAAPGP